MTNLLNPKVLLFMIAFLPQFTSPEQGPVWSQMLVLGVTMKILSLPYGSCFAYGASRIRGWVGRNAWFLRAQQEDCWAPSCWAWRHMCFTPRPRPESLIPCLPRPAPTCYTQP